MTIGIFGALLFAALLHAVWNAFVRRDPDRDAASTAFAIGGLILGVLLLPFLPPIAPAAVPYAVGSSFIHVCYFILLARAYRAGELSVAYPIMRGLAPLIVTIVGLIFIEQVSAPELVGIVIVAVGIVSLGLDGRRNGANAIGPALMNAVVIAAYTIVDGLGARASGAPATYVAWILIGGGFGTAVWYLTTRNAAGRAALVARLPMGFVAGIIGYVAYAIALWAMTHAPIGAVAAVRESSVLFATAIGALALKERFGRMRWLAAILVVAGLVLVKFGGG